MEERFIETARGRVYYWISKKENARCIVFTHGVTANHEMFEKQVAYFQDKYTVITWDVPIHGKSRPYRDFSYQSAAEDLNHILVDETISQVILVGMSMGGFPSQMFAIRYPEKVEGLVAIDTTPFGMSYYSKSDCWWLKQVKPMAKLFTDHLLRNSMAKSVSDTKYSYDVMLNMLKPLTKNEIIDQMDIAYAGFLKENQDAKFTFPVLILLGEHDKTGKVKQYCEAWSKKEGYPLHIIKNAAHFSNGDNPEAVNKEIEDFILGL